MADTLQLRLPMVSRDVQADRLEKLKHLFPEAFPDGLLDFAQLKRSLGSPAAHNKESFSFNWPGKLEALKAVHNQSKATLRPMPEDSRHFDEAKNLLIKGDSLEVLRLLQSAYQSKVKVIYIDPPYNTGKEHIYSDNPHDGLQAYMDYQHSATENVKRGHRLSTAMEKQGFFHSKWLSMIYPRLYLARNLLREDGAIFVSIDNHEMHTLRMVMDELFGAENFITTIVWQKVFAPKNSAKYFSEDHDYIVVYAKRRDRWTPRLLPRTAEQNKLYKNSDNDERGPWMSDNLTARNPYSEGLYSLSTPGGRHIDGPPSGRYWSISKEKLEALHKDNRIWWGVDGNASPRRKRFLSEVKGGRVPQTLWTYKEVGHSQEAKKELLVRVPSCRSNEAFDSPKPSRLIQRILQLSTNSQEEHLVLDFFAGSGTTGEAVMQLNKADGGNRRYILVQLPSPDSNKTQNNLIDVTRERLSNTLETLYPQQSSEESAGFRFFALDSSNFRIWNSQAMATGDSTSLKSQLKLFASPLLPDRPQLALLYELLLKFGVPLTAPISHQTLSKDSVFFIEKHELALFLEPIICLDLLLEIAQLKPSTIICLDHAFKGQDRLKMNSKLQLQQLGIRLLTA